MILQSLVQCYEDLAKREEVEKPGWAKVRVSYGLLLNDAGQIQQVLPLKTEQLRGNKKVLFPQLVRVPMPVKKSSNVQSNFLCDNAAYILGWAEEENAARACQCFTAGKELHLRILENVNTPAARAVKTFFTNWQPAQIKEQPNLLEWQEDFLAGANLVFWYQNRPVLEDEAIQKAWQAYYDRDAEDAAERMPCLVTGENTVPVKLHPSIKGVRGAQSSGASLVSFNATSFTSYDREQGLNAPTSKYAAFAYTTALNTMLVDPRRVFRVGDTSIVCWAEGGDPSYSTMMDSLLNGTSESMTDQLLQNIMSTLAAGKPIDLNGVPLDPKNRFYILGLSPNAARLSIRFFLQNEFGHFIENIHRHYQDLEIVKPENDPVFLPLWKIMKETVKKESTDKTPSPQLTGNLFCSILSGTPYPVTLINQVMLRIRAEHEISRGKAAIIKAFYLRNSQDKDLKEVLAVSLVKDSQYIPYVLGRYFAVLEAIQEAASPGINTTIKDRYFNSASATPAFVFPILGKLANSHLQKIDNDSKGLSVHYKKKLGEIIDLIPNNEFPVQLTLPEQGAFQLGYYHETQERYRNKKKEE